MILFKVSWLLGVKVFLAYATVSNLIEIIRRHVSWERQLFLQWTIKHFFTLQFTSTPTLRDGYQLKRSVNFVLWDFVVFDVHEPDRLPSAVLSGEKENSHCGFNLFYDFDFGEREVDDRDGGTDGSHDEVYGCVGGENGIVVWKSEDVEGVLIVFAGRAR